MKPTNIPSEWGDEARGEYVRRVDPPRGSIHVNPVEMLISAPHGEPEIFSALIELEEGDLDKLKQNGGRMWVRFWGSHLHPFSVDLLEFERFIVRYVEDETTKGLVVAACSCGWTSTLTTSFGARALGERHMKGSHGFDIEHEISYKVYSASDPNKLDAVIATCSCGWETPQVSELLAHEAGEKHLVNATSSAHTTED